MYRISTGAVKLLIVHLLGILGHIDLGTRTKDDILQFLVVSELLRTIRRHKHTLNIIALDDLSQVIRNRVHLLTHDHLVLRVLVVGDEALHHITPWTLTLDILCQTDTTRHRTIDKYTHSPRIREGHVVKRLHEDTKPPHKERRNDIDKEDARRIEMGEQMARQQVHTILRYKHQNQ